MKIAVAICAITLWAGTVAAATPTSEVASAESAARAWLGLVDAGNYAKSWSSASSLFRRKVSASQWESAAASARAPFGAFKSRTLQSATPSRV
jgi:Protein of unknown function (DUF4019)